MAGARKTCPEALIPPCRLVKDTSAWSNKKESLATERVTAEGLAASLAELDEEGLAAHATAAAAARDQAQAAADACAQLPHSSTHPRD